MEPRDSIKVLFLTAEAEPFARVGGLGDVAGALPPALRAFDGFAGNRMKLDVRLAIPFYGSIKDADYPTVKIAEFDVPTKKGPVQAEIFETQMDGMPVYLVAGPPIHPADPIYSKDFKADSEKFIFFSLVCLQLPKEIGWQVDILHANDWHTAAAIHQLKRVRKHDPFYAHTKGVISIHNLPFMGTGSSKALSLYRITASRNPAMPPWSRTLPLPMGIDAADWILTVSPHYAQEILTPAFGCDLQDYLKTKLDHLTGILNGLDTERWDPATDKFIEQRFDASTLPSRQVNKTTLQKELNLPENSAAPLLAYVGRMEHQKGVDLILHALSRLKPDGWQCVILGTGNPEIEAGALQLQAAHPEHIQVMTKFDVPLSHRIYAGADMLLMPSRYEPCGLAQMIAMRYGCLPVASATGGLMDTIFNHTADEVGTGFLFDLELREGLTITIHKAFKSYQNQVKWQAIQKNAMAQDHSWKNSALEYAKLYKWLVEQ